MATSVSEGLRQRLKLATAELHVGVEQSVGLRQLLSPDLTIEHYANFLRRSWDLHRSVDAALGAIAELEEVLPDWRERLKTESLAQDLAALGFSLPAAPEISVERLIRGSLPRALGVLYVLEGSTLGGQLIAKSLRQHSFIEEPRLHYLHHYGNRAGAYWQSFVRHLDDYGTKHPRANEEIVDAARATFTLIHQIHDVSG